MQLTVSLSTFARANTGSLVRSRNNKVTFVRTTPSWLATSSNSVMAHQEPTRE